MPGTAVGSVTKRVEMARLLCNGSYNPKPFAAGSFIQKTNIYHFHRNYASIQNIPTCVKITLVPPPLTQLRRRVIKEIL